MRGVLEQSVHLAHSKQPFDGGSLAMAPTKLRKRKELTASLHRNNVPPLQPKK